MEKNKIKLIKVSWFDAISYHVRAGTIVPKTVPLVETVGRLSKKTAEYIILYDIQSRTGNTEHVASRKGRKYLFIPQSMIQKVSLI